MRIDRRPHADGAWLFNNNARDYALQNAERFRQLLIGGARPGRRLAVGTPPPSLSLSNASVTDSRERLRLPGR